MQDDIMNLVILFCLLETTAAHPIISLNADSATTNVSQQITKATMRNNSAKKKKHARELKSRISLPSETKNDSIQTPNDHINYQANNIRSKLRQRSSYYKKTSLSVQGLNDILNEPSVSWSRLSPKCLSGSGGPLSRNEHRLSMLDLGFGKIESYTKLEKLGEGKTYELNKIRLFSFCNLKQVLMLQFIKEHRI